MVLSHSVMSNPLQLHGLEPIRLLCPQNFSGKSTGVGCHFLIQGIFPNPSLVSCMGRVLLYHWCHPGSWYIMCACELSCFSPVCLQPHHTNHQIPEKKNHFLSFGDLRPSEKVFSVLASIWCLQIFKIFYTNFPVVQNHNSFIICFIKNSTYEHIFPVINFFFTHLIVA